jgi:hypothetical protein
VEAYYDSRYNAVARWRYELGMILVFSSIWDVELYFARQTDVRPKTEHVNGVGITVGLHF